MDTSGCIVFPFCCLGLVISGVSTEAIVFLLSKRRLLGSVTKDQLFGIRAVLFVIILAICYFVISFLFRDLYVM